MSDRRTSFYDAFNYEFEKQLPLNQNYKSAFYAASNHFEATIGQSPYKSYDSFKVQRSKRKRK